MCGISGIINFKNKKAEEKDLRLMMQTMKHRGPDDEGVYVDDNVGLGFVRLSILDLSPNGHQPMQSEDNRYTIIYNGEVYNYIEIREELSFKYKFKSNTDTEVVLAAYQEWGEKCLEKFNGMFAFVIYDSKLKKVFGARDRFGIKPFYYYQDENQFIFASEIKCILPFVERKANRKIIYDYLMFNRTDHTNDSFFEGIKKIQHGYSFEVINNELTFKRWYNLSEKVKEEKSISPEEYRELFKDSLRLRLRSDVPIGVSLSGGIDSSCIVSSLYNDFNLHDINTFSAVYGENEPTDESEYIKEYSATIKKMHYIIPKAETFYEDFENFIETHNEPCPDTGPYAQYKVMELATKHVKVTLDGQGADEQLAGYHNFFSVYYLELIKKIKFLKLITENYQYFKKHRSIRVIKYLFYYTLPIRFQKRVSKSIYPSIKKGFFKSNYKNNEVNKMLYKPKSLNDSLLNHFEYKLEHLLKWGDLNAMRFSIESRIPFLDYRLVEATLSSPSNQKISKGETKYILREALKDILPDKITNRKDKKGFSNPRDKWFKSEKFKAYIYELINSKKFKERGIFDSKIANIQYEKHLKGELDASKEIWKWINLETWFQKFID